MPVTRILGHSFLFKQRWTCHQKKSLDTVSRKSKSIFLNPKAKARPSRSIAIFKRSYFKKPEPSPGGDADGTAKPADEMKSGC